jgi:oligoribonuclease (3'-5' exoribonuclease)
MFSEADVSSIKKMCRSHFPPMQGISQKAFLHGVLCCNYDDLQHGRAGAFEKLNFYV